MSSKKSAITCKSVTVLIPYRDGLYYEVGEKDPTEGSKVIAIFVIHKNVHIEFEKGQTLMYSNIPFVAKYFYESNR